MILVWSAAVRRKLIVVLSCLAAAGVFLFALTSAHADYQGPDENTGQAFGPLQGAHTYSATLNQSGGSPDDQDWYYYYVPAAGEQLHWTVSNTNAKSACPPYQCNVYATLEDSHGQQLGGNSSGAGTSGVPPGTTQTIDWTFTSPGKYYIAFIGDGPKISYQFSVTPATGVSATPPSGVPPTPPSPGSTPSLSLHAHQRGRAVDFSLMVPSGGGSLAAWLYQRASSAGSLHRARVVAGLHRFALRLTSRAWTLLGRRHRLSFTLRVKLTRSSGGAVRASKTLILRRR